MRFRILFLCFLTSFFSGFAQADELDGISVMTLSPADGKAVIKSSSQPLSVVSVGDSIFGSGFVVKQVLSDKLLVKDSQDRGVGNLIWVHKTNSGLSSRIERLEEVEPKQRHISTPGTPEQ